MHIGERTKQGVVRWRGQCSNHNIAEQRHISEGKKQCLFTQI